MTYVFHEWEGLITLTVNGQRPEPFMYIDGRNAPPWWVEPVCKKRVGPFESLEAAKFVLISSINQGVNHD